MTIALSDVGEKKMYSGRYRNRNLHTALSPERSATSLTEGDASIEEEAVEATDLSSDEGVGKAEDGGDSFLMSTMRALCRTQQPRKWTTGS